MSALIRAEERMPCLVQPCSSGAGVHWSCSSERADGLLRRSCMLCRRKKQSQKAYAPTRAGLEALLADVVLMCDNCRQYWRATDEELVDCANRMEAHAREVAEREYAGAMRLSTGRRR